MFDEFVTARDFREMFDDWPDHQRVVKDGVDRLVVPIGDEPIGEISIQFIVDGCPYALNLPGAQAGGSEGRGYYIDEAVEYAERF